MTTIRPFRILAFTLAAATMSLFANAAPTEGSTFDHAFAEAYAAFAKGVDGDEDAVIRSIRAFQSLFERYPNRWEAFAFYGSACTLRARDVVFFKKMDYVQEGFGAMDKAVAEAPNCSWTRLVRAINSYQVPGFFKRRDLAREDFGFLVRELSATAPSVPLASTLRQLTFYHAGRFAYEERDPRAVEWLRIAGGIKDGPIPVEDLDQALQQAVKRFGS